MLETLKTLKTKECGRIHHDYMVQTRYIHTGYISKL